MKLTKNFKFFLGAFAVAAVSVAVLAVATDRLVNSVELK